MRYRVLKNETIEEGPQKGIRDLRLREVADGIVYLDVVFSNGGRIAIAILWFDTKGELHIAKNHVEKAGLKYIGE